MENLDDKKTRLRKLRVYAVGLVDSPAVQRRYLILKRGVPAEKALAEAKFPPIHPPMGGAWKYCVCSKCGYYKKHEAGSPCLECECPKCKTKLVGSNTVRLRKEGGESKVVKPNVKVAVEEAIQQVAKDLEEGKEIIEEADEVTEEVETEGGDGGTGEVEISAETEKEIEKGAEGLDAQQKSKYTACMKTQLKAGKDFKEAAKFCSAQVKKEVEIDAETEKEIEKSAEGLDDQQKSKYTACMKTQLKAGKDFKEAAKFCSAQVKKEEVETEEGDGVEKAKVKVSVETEEKEKEKEQVVASDSTTQSFSKVFAALDRHIGESRKDEDKRKWRALKALVTKVIASLPVQKSETSLESFIAALSNVESGIDDILKAYPKSGTKYPNIPAGGFKPVFSLLDKLIGAAEEDVKSSLQKLKSMLSKLVGGTYPAATEKGELEASDAEELALLSEQIGDLSRVVTELKKGQEKFQAVLDKLPVPKGLVKKETPREQEADGSEDLVEKHKDETPPERLRSVIKDLTK